MLVPPIEIVLQLCKLCTVLQPKTWRTARNELCMCCGELRALLLPESFARALRNAMAGLAALAGLATHMRTWTRRWNRHWRCWSCIVVKTCEKHPRYGSNKDQNYSPPCRSFSPAFISYWLPISFEAKQWLKAWNGTNNPQLSFDLATSCWPTVSQDPLQYLSELLFDILWYCYHLLSLFIKLSSISCIATFRMPCSASMLWVYPCVLSFLAHAIVPEAGASLDLTND